jgi:L-alanine-DL-glutamate epimerase-like enolase superfamily enzyme
MRLKYYPYTIKLKEEFKISVNSRTTTPAIMVEVEHKGFTGFGEASLPPYLSDNQQSVIKFLEKVNFSSIENSLDLDSILDYIDNLFPGNYPAKAALDIALHDLIGKMNNISLSESLNIQIKKDIYSSYTIGITEKEKLRSKIASALDYEYLKIKLGTKRDKEIVSSIRELSDKHLFVDVNQGWKDKNYALDMISWLAEKNVILIEQPLPKEMKQESKWIKERSPLPIVADEAIQTLDDLN